VLLAYVAGTDAGLGLNTAHALGHKHNRLEQWLARLVLAVPACSHFTVEHGRGHHRWVATPEDHANARMGESIYRFALRELPGGIRRAWALEAERLATLGQGLVPGVGQAAAGAAAGAGRSQPGEPGPAPPAGVAAPGAACSSPHSAPSRASPAGV